MSQQILGEQILITGASGLLGQAICKTLDRRSIHYIKTSRRKNDISEKTIYMDLSSGEGIREAIKGKTVILHLASDKGHPDNDVDGTRLMLNHIIQDGLNPHFIFISVVGTNLIAMPYFKQKYRTEQLIIKSGIPFSILRATQFYEYIDQVLWQLLKFPIGLIPKKILVQPIDKDLVAEELVRMIFRNPTKGIAEIGGKGIVTFDEMAKRWVAKYRKQRIIWNIPLWGRLGRNLLGGALTTKYEEQNYFE
ncbi:MAG: SDR family oxidoreductase [Ginsengibacter sp.]